MSTRIRTVPATDAITVFAICSGVRPRSARTTGMSGAIANHAKKTEKNASHVMWNARICGVESEKSSMRRALWASSTSGLGQDQEVAGRGDRNAVGAQVAAAVAHGSAGRQ